METERLTSGRKNNFSRQIVFHDINDMTYFVTAAEHCNFRVEISYEDNGGLRMDAKSLICVLALGLERKVSVDLDGRNEGLEELLYKLSA